MSTETQPLLEPVERPMSRLFAYLRPDRGRLAYAVSMSALNKVFDLMPPWIVMWFVAIAAGETLDPVLGGWLSLFGEGTTERFVGVGVLAVLVFGGESVFQWLYDRAFKTLAQDVQHRLRVDAYSTMQDRELRFFEEHRLGRTLSMLNDDVNQLERFLNTGFNDLVQLTVLILFAGSSLLFKSWELALVGLVPVPVIVWGSLRFSKMLEPRYARVRNVVGDLVARLENNIAGMLVIKSFTAEPAERARVEAASNEYRIANHEAISLSTAFVPLIRMAISLGFAGSLVLGGVWAVEGRIDASLLVLFGMMIQRILWPMTRLGTTFDEYQRASASAARIFSLLDTEARVQDAAQTETLCTGNLAGATGEVEFDDVRFDYGHGEQVLRGLSFRVAPGETIGIAGPTGAGKSTLIKLLLRLYDVTGGGIRIDGHDVRALRQRELRRNIAVVTQDVYLFHGTIRENIAYGQGAKEGAPAGADAVEHAARVAHLHEFVASLPDGYETIVGERGIKLSGGQRQRLSIARAILKHAPVLVLDEATSSVDTETEREIQENLAKITEGCTALVVAHRLSTIRHADRILVLNEGRVAEEGRHDELVASGGLYADLWNVQSGNVTPAT
jgi:ATP-binding cassette subfamily B protein